MCFPWYWFTFMYLRLSYLWISFRTVKVPLPNTGYKVNRGSCFVLELCDHISLFRLATMQPTAKFEMRVGFCGVFFLWPLYFSTSLILYYAPSWFSFFLSLLLLNLQVCVLGTGKWYVSVIKQIKFVPCLPFCINELIFVKKRACWWPSPTRQSYQQVSHSMMIWMGEGWSR